MRDGNRALGKFGEDTAARFLSRKGYRIIGRNVRTFLGEIDIIAERKDYIVFFEIKTRRSTSFGPPYLAITEKKRRKLIQCALCYLKMKNKLDRAWQIDIISIELNEFTEGIKKIEHFENAVEDRRGYK
jgi:putative endonuclease